MRNLFTLSLPFFGEAFAQWDKITLSRWSIERTECDRDGERLICCGKLRLYFTPKAAQQASYNYHQEE